MHAFWYYSQIDICHISALTFVILRLNIIKVSIYIHLCGTLHTLRVLKFYIDGSETLHVIMSGSGALFVVWMFSLFLICSL